MGVWARDILGRSPGGEARRRTWGVGVVSAALVLALWGGCAEEAPVEPNDSQTNIVIAQYQSEESFVAGVIEINGERLDPEWGSEFSANREFTHVRLSAQEGAGNPGTPRYISMKAIYTDEHLYLLFQWRDWQPNLLKDAFVYMGPNLGAPLITCAEVGGETVCDSIYRKGAQDSLLLSQWWGRTGEDDKLAIAFEIEPTSDSRGSFADIGCQIACHGNAGGASFGQFGEGRLDVWYWLAGRTNPIRDIFDPYDLDPDDPVQGTPGYLDDMYMDAMAGLIPDAGAAGYIPNVTTTRPGTPKYAYRIRDDDFNEPADPDDCVNRFGEDCRVNNGVSFNYLWRENPHKGFNAFSKNDTLNQGLVEARLWATGDICPGYILTYPDGSRADVRGKGNFSEDNRIWTLEVARLLDTPWTTNDDVLFDPDIGKDYYFTISLFDGSLSSHWGSEPQVLRFAPREPNAGGK